METISLDRPSQKGNSKEWLDKLFSNIERCKEEEMAVPFQIVECKKNGLLVKTKGLFACVPYQLMPWQYRKIEQWKTVLHSLKDFVFYGTVKQIEKSEDGTKIGSIIVDANMTAFREVELNTEEVYEGIVIQKLLIGVLIETGNHFGWKCGSIVGYIHQTKFADPESFVNCEVGQIMSVNFLEKNEKGLFFKDVRHISLREKYVGKTVPVRLMKSPVGQLDFTIDGRYKAIIPALQSTLPLDLELIEKMLHDLPNEAMINCEVLKINSGNVFILKYLKFEEVKNALSLLEQELNTYIGQEVKVQLVKKTKQKKVYIMEGQYKAELPLKKELYKDNLGLVKKKLSQCEEGDYITCKALKVDLLNQVFTLKYLVTYGMGDYTGQTVSVYVCRTTDGILKYLVENKYEGELPITESLYGKNFSTAKNVLKFLEGDEQIECKVIEVRQNKCILKLLLNKELTDRIILRQKEREKYIGRLVKVNVYQNNRGELDFKVENKYDATRPIFINYDENEDFQHIINDFWVQTKIIHCKIMNYDWTDDVYVLQWDVSDKKLNKIKLHHIIENYMGKIVYVKVQKSNMPAPDFFIDHKYPAEIKCSKAERKLLNSGIYDGEVILGKVIECSLKGPSMFKWVKTGLFQRASLHKEQSKKQ